MSGGTPTSNAAVLGRLEASIMAESALLDKETARVVWEGGSSSTLSASVYPKIGVLGVSHIKAKILTSLLLLVLVSFLAQLIRKRLVDAAAPAGVTVEDVARPLLKSISLFLLQRTPQFDGSFVILLILLYLLEAHTCSTRRYLANAINSQSVVDYIEALRQEPPIVTWKVRCFHYEKPYWMSPVKTGQTILQRLQRRSGSTANNTTTDQDQPVIQKEYENVSGPFRRKVISHEATANYTFNRFVDDTMAGVWKRQEAESSFAPFMKITLSKILVLANEDARKDYFKQQSNFVTAEGMRDKFAEYSTNIEVPGFRRRMLAIRPVKGVPSSKLFRLNTFWIFTLLGLSLPYRIWFARHCDQLRVTVVKETYAEVATKSSFTSWFTTKSTTPITEVANSTNNQEVFRRQMQTMLLPATRQEEPQPAEEVIKHISDNQLSITSLTSSPNSTKPEAGEAPKDPTLILPEIKSPTSEGASPLSNQSASDSTTQDSTDTANQNGGKPDDLAINGKDHLDNANENPPTKDDAQNATTQRPHPKPTAEESHESNSEEQ